MLKYRSWILPLSRKINKAIENVAGQMSMNFQLVLAHENYQHYKNWADAHFKTSHRIIESQRHEIQLLNRARGRSEYVSALNGHISTDNQKQINGFVDEGLGYIPNPPTPYMPPTYDDLVGARMLKRVGELCDVHPDHRLAYIADEFPYVSLLQAEM